MVVMDVRGFVAQANAAIRAAEAAHLSRKAERQRLRMPLALIDGVINDLELLNLRGVKRVPVAYEGRLLQLRHVVAGTATMEQLDNIRTRVRPVKLMDAVYTVQESLFGQSPESREPTIASWGCPPPTAEA